MKNVKETIMNGSHIPNGLSKDYADEMAVKLNGLLSSLQVLYANVRGYHWNVTGAQFFTLHDKFEELYNDLSLKADEVAERVLALDHQPAYRLSEFVSSSSVGESSATGEAAVMISELISSLRILLQLERQIIKLAEAHNDVTTADLMTGYAMEQEKLIWMYGAWLERS